MELHVHSTHFTHVRGLSIFFHFGLYSFAVRSFSALRIVRSQIHLRNLSGYSESYCVHPVPSERVLFVKYVKVRDDFSISVHTVWYVFCKFLCDYTIRRRAMEKFC